ncbi:MAG: FIST C-terminal domain-containing protein [Betaproteobacteria bacterium]|nr:FIST C-terminal domain-containing protein [Betaproteobacteria bacterium]
MKTQQVLLKDTLNLDADLQSLSVLSPGLVLVFGGVGFFSNPALVGALRRRFPHATFAGCSTAGEIHGNRVYDSTASVTAIEFDRTMVDVKSIRIASMPESFAVGARLAQALPAENLTAVLLFGTGVAINGSALVAGLQSILPGEVKISGGLAGDGGKFVRTWTLGPSGATDDHVVAVGLYGRDLHFACGSFAGWVPFGPARKVTRCDENVLFELDGERALDVYKRYLGEYAEKLPASGLLFPFEMLSETQETLGVYRTILGIDEAAGSLTLAGDINPDGYLKLMHASTDKLIDGAETAAQMAGENGLLKGDGSLAILVSCVGRKIIMGDRVEEEVEVVADQLPVGTALTGFYSNGEISSTEMHGGCRLHNQTMTISWMAET